MTFKNADDVRAAAARRRRSTGCWSRPTRRTSRRCRTADARTSRAGSSTSARRSPPRSGRPVDEVADGDPARTPPRSFGHPRLTCASTAPAGLPRRAVATVDLRLRRGWTRLGTTDTTSRRGRTSPRRDSPRTTRHDDAHRTARSPIADVEPHDAAGRSSDRRTRHRRLDAPPRRRPRHVDARAIERRRPSPRAEPHDAAAWLPLPDDLARAAAGSTTLLEPDPDVQAAVVAEAEAVVHDALAAAEAAVAPSPARAEPHDAAAWLPLPDSRRAPRGHAASSPRRPAAATVAVKRRLPASRAFADRPGGQRARGRRGWAARQLTAPGGSQVDARGRRHAAARCAATPAPSALLAQRHVTLGLRTPSAVAGVAPRCTTASASTCCARSRSPSTSTASSRTVRTTEHDAPTASPSSCSVGKLVARPQHPRPAPRRLDGRAAHAAQRHRSWSTARRSRSTPVAHRRRAAASPTTSMLGRRRLRRARAATPCWSTADTVTVVRVGGEIEQEHRADPVHTEQQADPTLPIGQTRVVQHGATASMDAHLHGQRRENGEAVGTHAALEGAARSQPVPQIIGYGTKADSHWDELGDVRVGRPVEHRRPAPAERLRRRPRHLPRHLDAFGGAEFAPNAGLATREEQIIVGQRIYDRTAVGIPWGCANNVLHWPQCEHVSRSAQLTPTLGSVHVAMRCSRRRRCTRCSTSTGCSPKKSLGQHFLADPNTARRVVALAEVHAGDPVARDRSRPRLAHAGAARRRRTTSSRSSSTPRSPRVLRVGARRRGRAATSDGRRASRRRARPSTSTRCSPTPAPWACVSNLPYNVAMPGGRAAARGGAGRRPASLVMVQREVGERLAAGPGRRAVRRGVGEGRVLRRGRGRRRRCPPRCSCPGPRSTRRSCGCAGAPTPPVDGAVGADVCSRWCAPGSRSAARCCAASLRAGARRARARACSTAAGVAPTARAEALGLDEWAALARSAAAAA